MSRLRLFPLRTVLFPGMPLPLQVFEERYRYLVSECLASGDPFGVVLIRSGEEVGGDAEPHAMGCTARIERVTPADGDRLLLQTRGLARFTITRVYHDRAYLSADVEYPVDEVTDVSSALFAQAARGLEQLLRLQQTIAGNYERRVAIPDSPGALADAIGAAGNGFVPAERLQSLLETLDVDRRLERAVEILGAALEATHTQAERVVARRWGSPDRKN